MPSRGWIGFGHVCSCFEKYAMGGNAACCHGALALGDAEYAWGWMAVQRRQSR